MFHIVVMIALAGQPAMPPIVVTPGFDDVATCESERTGPDFTSALDDLKAALEKQGLKDAEYKTVCAKFNDQKPGRPA